MPGKFNESGPITASITTTDLGGYTLRMTGPNEQKKLVKGGTDLTNGLSSITGINISSSSFNDNEWGLKYCKKANTLDNCLSSTNYMEAPGNSYIDIDITETANSTPAEYAIAIGAKVGVEAEAGDNYSGTLTILASANPTPDYGLNSTNGYTYILYSRIV